MSDEMKEWKKQLLSDRKNGYDKTVDQDAMEAYCAGYKDFLDRSKTERLCAAETVRMAEEKGYRPYARGMEVKAGDRVYVCNRGKSVLLAHIGTKSLAEGAQIAAAHLDSPRSMRTVNWPISRPITTAGSASTSGSPFPWSSMAWWR